MGMTRDYGYKVQKMEVIECKHCGRSQRANESSYCATSRLCFDCANQTAKYKWLGTEMENESEVIRGYSYN